MKRFVLLIIPALICGMMFTSCEANMDADSNFVVIETARIKATSVENGNDNIAIVKAIIVNRLCLETEECRIEYEVATSNFKNNGFELNFSKKVPDEYLTPVFVDEGITVSDIHAQIGTVDLEALDSAGDRIGYFSIISADNQWFVYYIYADRSFTMKGKTEYGLEIDYSFNKGWNIIYCSYEGMHYYTTQKPLNEDFKCYFPSIRHCGTK